MPIKNRFAELHAEITGWRRDLHTRPEILFEVHKTAATVEALLREFGCDEVVTGLGRTGVVGVIRGRSDSKGRVIGLRADMDALPILEETGADYASATPGAMHACGHDGHMAMLLGAAKYLCETRNFDGTAVVIFQPAEEGGGGGREMCEDGLMGRFGIQEVYGMHNWPGVPLGTFAIRSGPFFASTDQFEVVVKGSGGHAAKPHLAIDPVLAAAQMITGLQSIASRNADPVEQVVVSVTSLESSSKAFNVIPGAVTLRGTVRTMSDEARAMAEDRLRVIAEGMPAALGCEAEMRWLPGYPTMVNAEAETEIAAGVARRVAGECALADMTMGGEDFAYMLQERPGAYILVGNGESADLHNPAYDFNDEAIPAGCSYWAELVESRMPPA